MKNVITRFVREENGQDLIEYALLAGFIALAAVVGITAVGGNLQTLYQNVADKIATITF